jgi:hypothetical protein
MKFRGQSNPVTRFSPNRILMAPQGFGSGFTDPEEARLRFNRATDPGGRT